MLKSLASIAEDCGFDKILAYACFASVNVEGKDYLNKAPLSTADYCNKVSDSSKFLDLSPGDIFISEKDGGIIVPLTRSLHVGQKYFTKKGHFYNWPSFENLNIKNCVKKAKNFCKEFDDYLIIKQKEKNLDIKDIGIEFIFQIIDENEELIEEIKYKYFNNVANRVKICRVRASVLNEVLNGKIPFEDLSIGYLAEWDREPHSIYNKLFMTYLKSFWNEFIN